MRQFGFHRCPCCGFWGIYPILYACRGCVEDMHRNKRERYDKEEVTRMEDQDFKDAVNHVRQQSPEGHGSLRFTAAQVVVIRRLLDDGYSAQQLATAFRTSVKTVQAIQHHRGGYGTPAMEIATEYAAGQMPPEER